MAPRARSTHSDTGLLNGEPRKLVIQGAEILFATVARTQREMLDFAALRLEKDGDTIRELTACQTWTDALSVQSRWVQETIRDYAAEATKLLALSTNADRQAS